MLRGESREATGPRGYVVPHGQGQDDFREKRGMMCLSGLQDGTVPGDGEPEGGGRKWGESRCPGPEGQVLYMSSTET